MAMDIKNDRLLKALQRQPVDRTPIWLMRQAGRYLPEYRATRARAGSFLNMCQQPELACEVTLQPLARFPLDAAILFSDILMIPHAMGLGLSLQPERGPCFAHPIRDARAIAQLPIPDPEQELAFVPAAVRLIVKALQGQVPLIGFAGSPFTVATYMIEGQSSKQFSLTKKMLYQAPNDLHKLLSKITTATVYYLKAQIAAGVSAVMLFDTWGGILTTMDYQRFSLEYMQQIIQALKADSATRSIPTIMFTKAGNLWLELMAATGVDAIGLDWSIDITAAKARVGNKVALQGNLDPAVLHARPDIIAAKAQAICQVFPDKVGHIFNLGHGLTPDIDPERVAALVEAVHQ